MKTPKLTVTATMIVIVLVSVEGLARKIIFAS